MKEKLMRKKEELKEWWSEHKNGLTKLTLAGAGLYMLGYIHATNKVIDRDRVVLQDHQDEDVIEVVDL